MSSFSKQGDEIFFTLLNSGGDHVEEGERKIYIPDGSCYKFTCKADLNSDLTVANLKEKLKLELGGGCIYSLFAAGVEDALGDAVQVICITDALFAVPGELSPLEQYNHDPEAYLEQVKDMKQLDLRDLRPDGHWEDSRLFSILRHSSEIQYVYQGEVLLNLEREFHYTKFYMLVHLSNIIDRKMCFDYMLDSTLFDVARRRLSVEEKHLIFGNTSEFRECGIMFKADILACLAYANQLDTLDFLIQENKSLVDLGAAIAIDFTSVLYYLMHISDYLHGGVDTEQFGVALAKLMDAGASIPVYLEEENRRGSSNIPAQIYNILLSSDGHSDCRHKFEIIQGLRKNNNGGWKNIIRAHIASKVRGDSDILAEANRIIQFARDNKDKSYVDIIDDQIFSGNRSCSSPIVVAYLATKESLGFMGMCCSIAETNTLRQLNKEFPNSQAQDGAGQGAGGDSSMAWHECNRGAGGAQGGSAGVNEPSGESSGHCLVS